MGSGLIIFLNSPFPGKVRDKGNTKNDLEMEINWIKVSTECSKSPQAYFILLNIELEQLIVYSHLMNLYQLSQRVGEDASSSVFDFALENVEFSHFETITNYIANKKIIRQHIKLST